MSNPFSAVGQLFDTVGDAAGQTGKAFSTAGNWLWHDITGQTNAQLANNAQWALQKDQQAYNAWQAQLQREWSAQSVQTAVKDIKAAGLNPWLAVQGGVPNAASTSAASSAQGNADMGSSQLGLAVVGLTSLLGSALKVLTKKR